MCRDSRLLIIMKLGVEVLGILSLMELGVDSGVADNIEAGSRDSILSLIMLGAEKNILG